MITKMKETNFSEVNDAKWKEIALESLRGLPFERLLTKTIEGIEIQPLYTKAQVEENLPKQTELLQAVRSGINTPDWTVAQASYANDGDAFIAEVKTSLEKGNEALVYDGSRRVNWTDNALEQLAELLKTHPIYAYNVQAEDEILKAFARIAPEERNAVKGVLSGTELKEEGYHLLRKSVADTIPAHLQGADIITELALALSIAAEQAEDYQSFTQFENQFFVRFAVDTEFFMEIAKLRAFRVLWQTFAKAYGVEKPNRVPVYSETSLRTYSKLDPYVNLLRAGNEAFSAVLGGTDVLTVHPHNVVANVTNAAIRYARNIQLIIKEETFVQYVLDPAGGSYFIDTLTNELIEKAWTLFQKIESQGGYTAYVESGNLVEKIAASNEARVNQVSTGKKSLIGTNIYADLTNEITNEATVEVPGRLAEPYENLRVSFADNQPKTVLLTFGSLKEFKARMDFASGFLATGGIQAEASPAFADVAEARAWMKENEFDYGIICAHPKETENVVNELAKEVPHAWLDVAGQYDGQNTWEEAGIAGSIFAGQNKLEKLQAIQKRWTEEGQHAKA